MASGEEVSGRLFNVVGQAVRSVVSVSFATRGQTDIRGLVTCRTGCSAGASRWSRKSSVAPRSVAALSTGAGSLHALPRPAGTAWLLMGAARSVVEDRQGPAPSGQFAGDRDVGDHGLL